MHRLRWMFVGVFSLVVLVLFLVPVTRSFGVTWVEFTHGTIALALFFGSQAMYLYGAGTLDLCRPIRKRRLWLPVTVGSALLAILTGGLILAAVELLLGQRNDDWFPWVFLALILGAWLSWAVLLWIYTWRIDRFQALHWMTTWIFAGSLAEMLATLPAHLWTQGRRGGCFAFHGMWTGVALMAGIVGLVWAFGPAVVLLLLSKRYHEERIAQRMRRMSQRDDETPE